MSSFKTFNGYEVEDAVARKSVGELSKIAPAIGMVDGTGVTITDSAEGVVIDFDVYGRSTQAQYSGKNLANVKDRTSQTRDGITSVITNKIISASGTATSSAADIVVDLDTPIMIKSGTHYTLSLQKITGTMPTGFTVYLFDSITSTYPHYYDLVNTNSITFNLASDISCSSVLIRIPMSNTINGTFRIQLEEGTTATVYEPYVGGTASPNPSYPQAIKSVGDMGYFDGELLNGVYNTSNGIYGSNANYLCNKNPIPCNASDEVTFTHHTDTQYNLMILFYDVDMNYLSYKNTTTSDTLTATAPTNASYCNFNIGYGSALSVANASPITVTINDKYALIVDSNNDRKYIPISAPLRGLGGVTDVSSLSEREVERKFAEVVFDGSDDEGWSLKTIGCELYLNNTNSGNALCTHYKKNNGVSWGDLQGNEFNIIGTVLRIKDNTHQSTLDEWKSWLQSNPITVIYELAEPITESIVPVEIATYDGITNIICSDNADCEVVYYRNNEDGKKMRELDNRMVTAEDTINNLESNAVAVAGDIEDIKTSLSENPLLVTLAPSDELPTIVAGSNVGTFKDTWLNRVINDYEYLIIVVRHRNGSKQIVQIPSMLIEIGGTYTFPFNDVQNNINGAYITINSATRYGIGIFGTLPNDISFELYKYGKPISVG